MKHTNLFVASIILCSILSSSVVSHAATLSVTPATARINQGSTFSVTVRTNTSGVAVNVAEATVTYPSDKLEVISATAGDTFPLQTPGSPRTSAGQVFFSGGVPSGYTGTAGIVGRITFRAKAAGNATIAVANGRVLLNDGNATDALRGTSPSTITIQVPPQADPAPIAVPPAEAPVESVVPVPEVVPDIVIPSPVVDQGVAPEVVPTTVIRTEDLINLIYVLVGLIVLLLLIIVILIIMLIRRRPQVALRKPATSRKSPVVAATLSEDQPVPTLSKTPRRKARSVEPV